VLYLDETINSVLDNPLKGVSRDASLDAIRFYLMSYQSLDRDFDWSERNFQSSAVNRLNKFIRETKKEILENIVQTLQNSMMLLAGGWELSCKTLCRVYF